MDNEGDFFSRVLALNRDCLNQRVFRLFRLFRLLDSDFPIGFSLFSTLSLHKSKSFDLVVRWTDPVTAVSSVRVHKAQEFLVGCVRAARQEFLESSVSKL